MRFSRFHAIRHGIDQGSGLDNDLIRRGTFNDLPELSAQADKVSVVAVDVEAKRVARTEPVRHGSAVTASDPATENGGLPLRGDTSSMSKTSSNSQSEKIRRK